MVVGGLKPQEYYRHSFQRKCLKCETNGSLCLLKPLGTFSFSACFPLFACIVNASCSYAGEGAGVSWKNAAGSFQICLSEGIKVSTIPEFIETLKICGFFFFIFHNQTLTKLIQWRYMAPTSSPLLHAMHLTFYCHNNLARTGINWTIM